MTPKEKQRDYHLRRRYGITLDQYNEILKSQDYRCAVCGKHQSEEKRSFHVDHLHKSPYSIRGILCAYCNQRVIGRHTNPEIFLNAYKYLTKPSLELFAPEPRYKRKKSKRLKDKSNNGKRKRTSAKRK